MKDKGVSDKRTAPDVKPVQPVGRRQWLLHCSLLACAMPWQAHAGAAEAARAADANPVLKDLPFVKSLTFDVASRYSDYSNFGSTHNSKVSVEWRPDAGTVCGAHGYLRVDSPNERHGRPGPDLSGFKHAEVVARTPVLHNPRDEPRFTKHGGQLVARLARLRDL